MPQNPERIEWEVLLVYEPATGRVSVEEDGKVDMVLGYLKEDLDPGIARQFIKAKLAFIS